jgi:PKD repeat protein
MFGNGQATVADFTVRAERAPMALFGQEPQAAVAGEPVQFVAQAEAVAGRSFAWRFSDGAEAAGRGVSHVFAEPGAYTVRLTVRDANGLSSEQSAAVSVTSAELRAQVQLLADEAIADLNNILARAGELELAADYFAEGVSGAGPQLVISGVLNLFGGAMTFAEFKEWVKLTLNQEVVATTPQEALPWLTDCLLAQLGGSSPQQFSGLFMPGITAFIRAKKQEIQQMREEVLAALPALSPEQAQALVRQLGKRNSGNAALSTYYENRARLPSAYADLKQADETSWSMAVADPVFNFSVGLGLTAATAGASGLAAILLPVSSQVADFAWEQADIMAGQSLDVQMLNLTTAVLGDATSVAKRITDNVKASLAQVRDGRLIEVPAGQMELKPVTVGGIQVFGFSKRWFAKEARVEVTIRNTGSVPATYWLTGSCFKRFTTTELRRFGITFASRSYDIYAPLGPYKFALAPGHPMTQPVVFLDKSGGDIPQGPILFYLQAETTDGFYLLAIQQVQFGTTFVDENGNVLPPEETEGLVLSPNPVRAWVGPGPEAGQDVLTLHVFNPLEEPLLTEVRQPLPAQRGVLDAGDATVAPGELVWEAALAPGQSLLLPVLLKAPEAGNDRELPATTLSAHDAVNEHWENFQATPVVIGTPVDRTPAWEGPLRLSAEGFEAWLQAPVPGDYRVEVSSDLKAWETLVTLSNISGRVRILDPAATNVPHRFYRAVQQR